MVTALISEKYRKIIWLVFFGLILMAVVLRGYRLNFDSPGDQLVASREFQTDEGAYLHNAVHKALFGRWLVPDDFNPMAHTPVYAWLHAWNFQWRGVSFTTARSFTAVLGLLAALLLWLGLKRDENELAALMGFMLLAFSHAWIFYNRVASAEVMVIFFQMASMLCWVRGIGALREPVKPFAGQAWMVLATLLWLLAVLTKPIGMLFLPVYLLMLGLEAWQNRPGLRQYLLAAGLLLVLTTVFFGIWSLVWIKAVWPYWRDFSQTNIHDRFSLQPLRIIKNYLVYLTYCPLFFQAPLIFLAALGAAGRTLFRSIQGIRPSALELGLAVWFIGGVLALGFFAYSPLRFNLLALPPACGLSAILAADAWLGQLAFAHRREAWFTLGPIGFYGLWQIVHGALKGMRWLGLTWAPEKFYHIPYGGLPANPGFYLAMYGFIAAALLLVWLLKNHYQRLVQLSALAVCLTLCASSLECTRYFQTAQPTMQTAGQAIARIVRQADPGPNPVLAGDVAPTLALENHLFAIHSGFGRELSWRRMLRFQPRFLVASTTIDLEDIAWRFPGFPRHFQALAEFPVFSGADKLILFRIDPAFYKELAAQAQTHTAP